MSNSKSDNKVLTETKKSNKPLYPKAKKLTTIDFLSSSQECDYIEYLVGLDTNPQITEESIINKLFIRRKLDNTEILFLKNKYLYLYGEGAIYYLQANYSMKEEKHKGGHLEVKELLSFLEGFIEEYELGISNSKKDSNEKIIKLISLGSANATKEITSLRNFIRRKNYQGSIQFIPIDVSTPLLQLAVLGFNQEFADNNKITIHPLLGDFWNIASSSTEKFKFNEEKTIPKIFTLLGSTIGNYKEADLLEQIIKFMEDEDYLIIGFDLLPSFNSEVNKNEVYDLYNTLGNVQFMLNPLSYVPKYRGYVSSFDKYFKLDKTNAMVLGEDARYSLITNIEGSVCYAPKLEIPLIDKEKRIISLAQSTKYDLDNFITWIKEFSYSDKVNDQTLKFNVFEDNKKVKDSKCFLVLQKYSILNRKPKTIKIDE